MAEVREQRQRQRADARAGRRPDVDDADQKSDDNGSPVDLKRAVTAAFTAAVAGALAGAAKAAVDKHRQGAKDEHNADDDREEAEQDERPGRTPTAEAEQEEDPEEDTGPEAEVQQGGDPPVESAEREASGEDGASTADVAAMIARAKEHVESVLGSPAEGVSGIGRDNGNWRVNVEVVQMRRVPESTDVLASYTVVLDAEGNLISLQELRRYRRSQAEDGR
ncbi:MAG: gas vesicle protein GvpO [Gaiellaceae bacterium]|jgi:hypothetical protein